MNKLLLVALFGLTIISLTGAQEHQGKNLEEVQFRAVRATNAGASKRASTSKTLGRKVKNKNGGTQRKMKKQSNKQVQNKQKRKQTRKASKKNKNKKIGRKVNNANTMSSTNERKIEGRSCGTECIDSAASYLKLLKGKVVTLKKQMSLINRHSGIATKKSAKDDIFMSSLARLIDNSGGDAEAPTCGTATSGAGVDQILNLTATLNNCSVAVSTACVDPPSIDVTNCSSSIVAFETLANACIEKDEAELCDCWTADDIATAADNLKDLNCDFKEDAAVVKAFKEDCKEKFGKCRKYEDAVGDIINACDQDVDALKQKLKNLDLNSEALDDLSTQINEITGVTTTVAPASGKGLVRQAMDCSTFIAIIENITTIAIDSPYSYDIYTLSLSLIGQTVVCTEDEVNALVVISVQVSAAIDSVASETEYITMTIYAASGTVITEAEIEALVPCTTLEECAGTFPEFTAAPTTAGPTEAPGTEEPVTVTGPTGEVPISIPTISTPMATASTPVMTTATSMRRNKRFVQDMLKNRKALLF